MNATDDDKLIEAARGLRTEISPERDLWPGIAAAIAVPTPPRWAPLLAQAAAIVLLVGASSAITYVAVSGRQQPVTHVAPGLLFEQTSFGGRYNLGPGFLDARDALAVQLDTELARLPETARADVMANLEFVHTAIAEINKALEEDPENVTLQAKLLGAYREELSVLRRVGGLTRNVMARNDI